MQSKETWITPTITGAAIADAVQTVADHLEANPAAVDALARAGLEDYTSKRREMGLDGDLTEQQQHRAIARYAYLMGYAMALGEAAEQLDTMNREPAGRGN